MTRNWTLVERPPRPLADALTAEENRALRQKVLARRQGCMLCAAGGWSLRRQRSA